MEAATRVATYAFLDLETSGLPQQEQNRTRITELSLVAVKRSHLLSCREGESPRVKHKLTLCLNPGRIITASATNITGLSNDLLENEPYFKNAFDTIYSFVLTMKPPVCILAHNGYKFDFPILKAMIDNIEKKLPNNLLCADTILAYHDIFNVAQSSQSTDELDNKCDVKPENYSVNSSPTMHRSSDENINSQSASEEETDLSNIFRDIQQANESTPKRHKTSVIPDRPIKRKCDDSHAKAKRRLTWQECKGKSMENIYHTLVKKDSYKCHEAESDCMMNLECAVAVKEEFVRWVDENHSSFQDITPMTIGVRLE